MKIFINGEHIDTDVNTLKELCEKFSEAPEFVATAVNGLFVPKSKRQATILSENDTVDIVVPLEGG
jgi:sulfur carrier protein